VGGLITARDREIRTESQRIVTDKITSESGSGSGTKILTDTHQAILAMKKEITDLKKVMISKDLTVKFDRTVGEEEFIATNLKGAQRKLNREYK
jgi:hypothetical protein